MAIRTRFAPSPTGFLHIGHAYSAFIAAKKATEGNGEFHLRIENIDKTRCKTEYEVAIQEDLSWLGLVWSKPVTLQSDRMSLYDNALKSLIDSSLLYHCFCTRKDIAKNTKSHNWRNEKYAAALYPGTCRRLGALEIQEKINNGDSFALRLKMNAAIEIAGSLAWYEQGAGEKKANPRKFGDIIIARKELNTSYNIACVIDDESQGINLVTRGTDLYEMTHIQVLLQSLLNIPTPEYLHHKLILDNHGNKLAKSKYSTSIRKLRSQGRKPEDILNMIGIVS
jgi:glutamyl-Q tRNA(Asp) synthetase